MIEISSREILIFLLVILDIVIIIILIYLYLKFKKVLTFPWEDFERSLERAQSLVEKLRELRATEDRVKGKEQGVSIEERVLESFREGLSVKEIAKRLGLSAGEVEIILKKKGLL